MNKFDNLKSLLDKHHYPVIFFDMWGVLRDANFYPGALDLLVDLRARGIKIYIVSNTPDTESDKIHSCKKKHEFLRGVHYDEFLAAGEVLRLKFARDRMPRGFRRYYNFGIPYPDFQRGAAHPARETKNLDDADFIYAGYPILTSADFDPKKINMSKLQLAEPGTDWYLTTDIELLRPQIKKYIAAKIPIVIANPDKTVPLGDKDYIQQGSIGDEFRKFGIPVHEYGKPHKNMFDMAMEKLALNGNKVAPHEILMVDDTLETGGLFAARHGLSFAWITGGNGITGQRVRDGVTLDGLLASARKQNKKIRPKYLVTVAV